MTLKILVIDDENNFVEPLRMIIKDIGYDCTVTSNAEEGYDIIKNSHQDLVFLNLHILRNRTSPIDSLGEISNGQFVIERILQMHREGNSIGLIILTGEPSIPTTLEELISEDSRYGHSMFRKKFLFYPDREAIKRIIEENLQYNTDLEIESEGSENGKLNDIEKDLLKKLFYGERWIKVFPVRQGLSGARVLRVESKDGSDIKRIRLVKLHKDNSRLETEKMNYEKYVFQKLHDGNYSVMDSVVGIKSAAGVLSGFRSSFIGGEFKDTALLNKYCLNEKDFRNVKAVFENLFNALKPWQKDTLNQLPGTYPYSIYKSLNRFKDEDIQIAFDNNCFSQNYLESVKDETGLTNLYSPSKIIEEVSDGGVKGEVLTKVVCVSHGDLRCGNVIVNKRTKDVMLIDFARTGYAPRLTDMIELETSIKFELLGNVSLNEFFQLETILVNQENLKTIRLRQGLHLGDVNERILKIIGIIRKEAYELTTNENPTEYLYGLLYHTLNLLRLACNNRLLSPEFNVDIKRQAFVSVNLIFGKLQSMYGFQ